MRKTIKHLLARHASRWRSTRHIESHLRFPLMPFHEALARVTYKQAFGVWPNLETPRTISEKMCWLKIHDRRPVNAVIADKWRMRGYVESHGYGSMLNEVVGVWDSADDINFRDLPDAYALKVTNGSAWNIIKHPNAAIDERAARIKLRRWTKTNFADHKGEWYYSASPSRIIAEAYLDSGGGDIPDYKLFVFNGETKFIQYCEGRFTALRSLFMSPDWEPMPFTYSRLAPFHPPPPRPAGLKKMISAAHDMSRDFPLLRVDFYECGGKTLLGELTLNPLGGYTIFKPIEWNLKIGEWLALPNMSAIA